MKITQLRGTLEMVGFIITITVIITHISKICMVALEGECIACCINTVSKAAYTEGRTPEDRGFF